MNSFQSEAKRYSARSKEKKFIPIGQEVHCRAEDEKGSHRIGIGVSFIEVHGIGLRSLLLTFFFFALLATLHFLLNLFKSMHIEQLESFGGILEQKNK